jgi:hypothetical protein
MYVCLFLLVNLVSNWLHTFLNATCEVHWLTVAL